MYKLIENPVVMPKSAIDEAFLGKWVYIVRADIDPHGELVEGMPVVLGEYQFEGVEEGIYEKFDGAEYGRKLSYTLLSYDGVIGSVFGAGVAYECQFSR